MPRTERAGPPVIVEIALLAIRSKTTTLACSSLRSSCRVIWFGDRASIQSPPPVSLQVDLRPDLVAIVLREGRSSNGTIRGKEKIEIEIDGGGAAGAAAVSDWGGGYDGRRGTPARVHDVPHQARSFVILDLLQADVGLKG
ncbi:hypothetical protein MUK42_10735 [Musa troglodytarum]|uniref:Uncharacterized protein n=1 Tax=Musa troglodytarum TaxID=320322 RepID=A0A9E7GL90_9LILI|nr:hypothetical protein MUK42_10735 [Musa troglodytarum]